MATPRTEYYNFTQTYNLGTLQPIGYGPFPTDNVTGFTTLRFSGLSLVTARKPQQYVQTNGRLNIMLFDPSDSTKYATYKSNPIATGTPINPGTSESPYGTATFTDGDYSISTDVSDWNLFGGIASLDGLCVGFYSDASSAFPTTTECPDRHLSPVSSGSYKYWMWELSPATPANNAIKYSREEMVEKYANSIDSCPIFADRSTKDANGDQIDTTYLKSANATGVKKITTSLPPVSTTVSELDFFTNGRVRCDSSDMGTLAPYPSQSDSGKILQATWAGSPSVGGAVWVDKPTGVPSSVVSDEGKVLTVDYQGNPEWQNREHYFAGDGLHESTDLETGDITFSWAYTVGRHLTVNPSNQLCVAMPGALDDASAFANNLFYPVTNGDFSGAYVLMTRQNANETYDIGLRYIGSGTSSTFSFVGTETVVANDNTITMNPAVYMGETVTYSGNKFGTTTFNPTTHKAIYYSGLAMIGYISDTKIAIFKDGDGNVKVAFTSMEPRIW